jgi:sugar phosphate isomerase/epimerase
MANFKIALIPNDFSMDLEEVFKMCAAESVKYVELANMWNKSILDLNESEQSRVHELLDQYGLQVASIQTQIMKTVAPNSVLRKGESRDMHRDHAFNVSRIDRAIELAADFQTPFIVTYSFYKMGAKVTDQNWQQIFDDYAAFLPKLQTAGKTVVIECEADTYVGTIQQYLKLLHHFEAPDIRANLDLGNMMGAQTSFTEDDFKQIFPYVAYFHVKDRRKKLFGTAGAVFGEGFVPWRKVLPWFAEAGFSGYLSVEPHVHGANKFEMGRNCVHNLQQLLRDLDIPFE